MKHDASLEKQPVVRTVEEFDTHSGNLIERALFNHRGLFMAICLAITLVLGYGMTKLKLNASFEKTIPTKHPYIANYLKHKGDLGGLGNAVRIAVETTGESIYNQDYLSTLQRLSDEVFLMPGVDRAYMKSLWTPATQWRGVTEEGFESGPVIPNDYAGTPQNVEQVRRNVERSG
ncbi:MAG: RND family transporter, partial [Deltaproteobacteria bacterium]|nr:RND family transporter [Deltaproteobacteria bacterium]